METGKTRDDSLTVMTELVLPNDTNLLGNLLGGRLLHWIDIAGALCATRHAGSLVATLQLDAVVFRRPIKLGNIVELKSYVVWTGNTSIEVAVEVRSEDPLAHTSEFINKVYIVLVAMDEAGRKKKTIPYIPVTEDERTEYEEAGKRRAKRVDG
jgi:acyl-CoA hydrolase